MSVSHGAMHWNAQHIVFLFGIPTSIQLCVPDASDSWPSISDILPCAASHLLEI